jgi:hypothetical protein
MPLTVGSDRQPVVRLQPLATDGGFSSFYSSDPDSPEILSGADIVLIMYCSSARQDAGRPE